MFQRFGPAWYHGQLQKFYGGDKNCCGFLGEGKNPSRFPKPTKGLQEYFLRSRGKQTPPLTSGVAHEGWWVAKCLFNVVMQSANKVISEKM